MVGVFSSSDRAGGAANAISEANDKLPEQLLRVKPHQAGHLRRNGERADLAVRARLASV